MEHSRIIHGSSYLDDTARKFSLCQELREGRKEGREPIPRLVLILFRTNICRIVYGNILKQELELLCLCVSHGLRYN